MLPEGHAISDSNRRGDTGRQLIRLVLEEDCEVVGDQLHLNGTLKAGANLRKAGEDIKAQDRILTAGTPPDAYPRFQSSPVLVSSRPTSISGFASESCPRVMR